MQGPLLFFLLALTGTISPCFGAQRGDFILLAEAGVFTILDRYERPIPEESKAAIPAWAPFRITIKNGLLGDEITPAMHCRFRGKICYLLLDEEGKVVEERNGDKGFKILKNCVVMNDTIQVLKSGKLGFSPFQTPLKIVGRLAAGETLVRVFKRDSRFYLMRHKNGPRYGWSSLKDKNAWLRQVHSTRKGKEQSHAALIQRLKARVAEVNRDYRLFFEAFNRATARRLAVPEWQDQAMEQGIVFNFKGPEEGWHGLTESIRHLKAELESELLGTGYLIDLEKNRLVVKRSR